MSGHANEDLLDIAVDQHGVFHVTGDIDMASGPILVAAIADREGGDPVELDLLGVGFIDSSGLRTLLVASRHAAERGSTVVLHHVGPEVARLLQITATAEQFTIVSRHR
jgi:anti-anti-sigma factor